MCNGEQSIVSKDINDWEYEYLHEYFF